MARAFTNADRVQSDQGQSTITNPTVDIALPAGATEGNSGIIVVASPNAWKTPEQWHMMVRSGPGSETNPVVNIMGRANLVQGETNWSFPLSNPTNALVCWTAEEWANISYCPLVAKGINWDPATPVSSLALSATQAGLNPGYTLAVAALGVVGSPSAAAWSPVSWSGGFTEAYVETMGTGQTSTSLQLRVAYRYGAAGETGSWSTTATFDNGNQTGKTIYGALLVLRAENQVGDI